MRLKLASRFVRRLQKYILTKAKAAVHRNQDKKDVRDK